MKFKWAQSEGPSAVPFIFIYFPNKNRNANLWFMGKSARGSFVLQYCPRTFGASFAPHSPNNAAIRSVSLQKWSA